MTRVLIAGLGNMGLSHALAHHHHPDALVVGLVNRSGRVDHPDLAGYPVYPEGSIRVLYANTRALDKHA